MRGYLIDVKNNNHGEVDVKDGLDGYYRLIDCSCIDIAVRNVGGRTYNIVCDDEGMLKKGVVSAYMGNEPALVGSIILFGLEKETFELASLTDDDVKCIEEHVRQGFSLDGDRITFWPILMMDAFKF